MRKQRVPRAGKQRSRYLEDLVRVSAHPRGVEIRMWSYAYDPETTAYLTLEQALELVELLQREAQEVARGA